jgi:hypothetical protein
MDSVECRICLEENNVDDMISPCLCRGSQRYVHRNCLNIWREQNRNNYYRCSVCLYEYRISRVWWGKVLVHPATSCVFSLITIFMGGYLLGYGSSSTYNRVYYWFHHKAYHSPHRLQILFHSMAWVGIPGIYLFLKNNFGALANIDISNNRNININLPNGGYYPGNVNHYHHNIPQHHSDNIPDSDDEEENKERKEKKTKVARWEPKSSFIWVTFLVGSIGSFYYSYRFVNRHLLRYGTQAQSFIENIH